MNPSQQTAPRAPRALWRWMAARVAALLLVLVLVVLFFPWDWLRGPVNRYVSERTGRHFEITRRLDVKLGLTSRVMADGIEFANPAWARDPYLVKAEAAEFDIKLWPLLRGQVELPRVSLRQPVFGLQMQADGRRTWALGKDTADTGTVPVVDLLLVDQGRLSYLAEGQGADINAEFVIASTADAVLGAATTPAQDMPLSYKARGTWKKEAFLAQGRTGSVLQLSDTKAHPFPVEIKASAGRTSLQARGSISNLAALDGLDANFDLKGQTWADLYNLLGVVLPDTPPYALRGHLSKQGAVWKVAGILGRLGQSDLSGDLVYDRSERLALLSGKLQSKTLDFEDLGPLVGVPSDRSGKTTKTIAKSQPSSAAKQVQAAGKVLPSATLDLARLNTMNADVLYKVDEVKNAKGLPLERLDAHIRLTDGVLQLDPLDMGVAGGRLVGQIRLDANAKPVVVQARLDARTLQLNRLFPRTEGSLGKLNGRIDLTGHGNSIAQVLGSSSGTVALLMGKGELSNILLEFMGLDGGEIIKFLVEGDRNVSLRCAAAAFDVKQGLMSSRAILLDTSDTVINGKGQISLAHETLDLVLYPQPKDHSILSLRSPLKITGTFAAPSVFPDKAALAGRAGIAVLLGVINPLLALAATVETGPGKDADCERVLAMASPVKPPEKPAPAAAAVK
ncbi:AsmA family protein [Polaromonas sp. SM01]|uniref:AsmA family protein n=1 Tax=Polaromonas sp. SM01 TaxID=3085630 RepID=UPI002980B79A|nr:AsmA family protein [Polaromonas sp. SM01]MDW5443866.1 AsmA family protein [Polaromonas sp. SM01]